MSERGSWITEYIYCAECSRQFEECLMKLKCDQSQPPLSKYWSFTKLCQGIFAGRISGVFAGEELQLFEYEVIPALTKKLCHPLAIAVMAEDRNQIFMVLPPVRALPDALPGREFTTLELKARGIMANDLVNKLEAE